MGRHPGARPAPGCFALQALEIGRDQVARGEQIARIGHLGHRVNVARADDNADRPRPFGGLLKRGAILAARAQHRALRGDAPGFGDLFQLTDQSTIRDKAAVADMNAHTRALNRGAVLLGHAGRVAR